MSVSNQIFELAAQNTRPVVLEIAPHSEEQLIGGHQYLLGAIPFGSIAMSYPDQHLRRSAYQNLSLRGFKPLIGVSEELSAKTGAPILMLKLVELQTSAYDLLITRRVVCKVAVEGSLSDAYNAHNKFATGWGSYTILKRYAFEPQLAYGLQSALDIALKDLLLKLNL